MSNFEGQRPGIRDLIGRLKRLDFLDDSGLVKAQSIEEMAELTRRRRNNSAHAYLNIGVSPELVDLSAIISTSRGGADEADKVVLGLKFGSYTRDFMETDHGLDVQARFVLAGVRHLRWLKEAGAKRSSIMLDVSAPGIPPWRIDESSLLDRAIERGLEPLQPKQDLF